MWRICNTANSLVHPRDRFTTESIQCDGILSKQRVDPQKKSEQKYLYDLKICIEIGFA